MMDTLDNNLSESDKPIGEIEPMTHVSEVLEQEKLGEKLEQLKNAQNNVDDLPKGPGSPYNNQFLKPIQKGEVRNPNGRPKGSKSLSTRIREMMNDENFVFKKPNGEVIIKGKPMDIIVAQAMLRASKGDMRAFDMLGKYGFGSKVDVTTDGKSLPTPILSLEQPKEIIELEAENGVLRDDSNQEDNSPQQES